MFSDSADHFTYSVDSTPDPTFGTADMEDASLANFFSRPIKTQSFTWVVGAPLFETFNPWVDFFENKRVINRISNFNLLRCKLKVTILVNGNSFYYGRLIASYLPLPQLDNFHVNRSFVAPDIVAASQRPHVYIDPTVSQGGTLELPFFWQSNALSIPNDEWEEMGEMNIRSMQDLKHANGADDPITISVFVWAEDVHLSIPTATEPGALVPQMGASDEFGTGPISRPAGWVAKVAGMLTGVPTIGPYARATKIAASTVNNWAQMFGFSRPAVLADIQPYKPTVVGNMANTNVPDSCTTLALDAKQEVSVDPRIMGLGSVDEMTVRSIACRESWLTDFPWLQDKPAETLLWQSAVTPVTWNIYDTEIHMPACCFAALPFRYWRGTMKYRFQIVASAYHKGRLKITYDPYYPLTNEYNTNYIHIVDLAHETDFTIDIGWGQERSMVQHSNVNSVATPWRTTPLGNGPGPFGNGVISVYVVNELTTPNSTTNNDIAVNVFVSAGPDFEVFEPDPEDFQSLTFFKPDPVPPLLRFDPQMGEADEAEVSESAPMNPEPSDTLAATLPDTDETTAVFFGDPIVSFRQCLKRYNLHSSLIPSTLLTQFYYTYVASNFPVYRGYAPNALNNAATPVDPTPYNYCRNTLLNYLTPAFAARRGALRWKYVRSSTAVAQHPTPITAIRRPDAAGGFLQGWNISALSPMTEGGDFRTREALTGLSHTWAGAHATHAWINPVLEIELPWYSNRRFLPARASSHLPDFEDWEAHVVQGTWEAADDESPRFDTYVSTGEDFTLGFFLGAPRVYESSIYATPAASTPPP